MKRYLNNGEFLVSGLVLCVGVVFAILASQFDIEIQPDYPGPKLYPYIACFGLIVCGIGMLFQSVKKIRQTGGEQFLSKESWIKLGIILGILILFALLLHTVGFFIATPLACFLMTSYFARGNKVRLIQRVLYSVLFTGVLYLIYSLLFGMNMPGGLLF